MYVEEDFGLLPLKIVSSRIYDKLVITPTSCYKDVSDVCHCTPIQYDVEAEMHYKLYYADYSDYLKMITKLKPTLNSIEEAIILIDMFLGDSMDGGGIKNIQCFLYDR